MAEEETPRGSVLIVDDDKTQRRLYNLRLSQSGFDVATATGPHDALKLVKEKGFDVILSDLKMPAMSGLELYNRIQEVDGDAPFVLMTAFGTIATAVQAMKSGVFDYITKPIEIVELLTVLDKAVRFRRLVQENQSLRAQIEQSLRDKKFVYRSKQMEDLLELIRTVAPSEATVLIRGESGTGKELVATAIHELSPRSDGPFIKVNCAAIPEGLLEDELFGHEKGAFTDASEQRKGKFELAAGGTIFLDEIGDMPPALQVKILRVLQEREFERVGGTETIEVDTRLVAATNRNIEDEIAAGRFREDLYYRINVIPIVVPPLRDRKEDILPLASHFIRRFNEKNSKSFGGLSEEARELLQKYDWPGNVRELENAIERAVVIGSGKEIQPEHLPQNLKESATDENDLIARLFETEFTLEELEQELLRQGLQRTGWNQTRAAELLGISRRTLQYRMGKFGLEPTR